MKSVTQIKEPTGPVPLVYKTFIEYLGKLAFDRALSTHALLHPGAGALGVHVDDGLAGGDSLFSETIDALEKMFKFPSDRRFVFVSEVTCRQDGCCDPLRHREEHGMSNQPTVLEPKKIQRVVTSTLAAEAAFSAPLHQMSWVRVCWTWLLNARCEW